MKHENVEGWTARPMRRPVNLRGFALASKHDADVVVSDLSYEGCQICSSEEFTPGELIQVRIIRRGLAYAEIRWVAGDRAGLRFVS